MSIVYYYLCYTNCSIYYIDTSVSNASDLCTWHIDKVYAILYVIVWLILSVTHASGQGEPIGESSALGLCFHVCCRCEMKLLLSKRGAVPREVYFPSSGFLFKKKVLKGGLNF